MEWERGVSEVFPLTYTKRHEKRHCHTVYTADNAFAQSLWRNQMLGLVWTFPMVRHTVSGHFTLLRDLNLGFSFSNSNVEGLEQNMKVFQAYHDEYLYVVSLYLATH